MTQFMLLSNTVRANLTHQLWLKKEILPIFSLVD